MRAWVARSQASGLKVLPSRRPSETDSQRERKKVASTSEFQVKRGPRCLPGPVALPLAPPATEKSSSDMPPRVTTGEQWCGAAEGGCGDRSGDGVAPWGGRAEEGAKRRRSERCRWPTGVALTTEAQTDGGPSQAAGVGVRWKWRWRWRGRGLDTRRSRKKCKARIQAGHVKAAPSRDLGGLNGCRFVTLDAGRAHHLRGWEPGTVKRGLGSSP